MATDAGSIVVKIKGDASGLAKAIEASKKKVAGLGSFTEKHSKAFLMAGGAVMGALGASAKAAMDFQEQMANVSTMLGQASMKYMPEFSKGIQDMAAQFGEGTDTLADGLYNILSASVPPAKAMDVLKVSVESARAGLTDTGVAADAITTILNSYGLSADDAGKVSDKLFAIVKRGKTTFGELAPSIGRVAATAATAGVSLDDLGAMIATLTRAGISTDEAMTSVNGIITAFLKPTDDAKEAAAQFGLTLDSTTLKTLGFKGVLEKLNGATAEQLATIFPNVRALKGMAAALQSATGFAEDYKTMLNATGSTQEAFGKQSDTAAFKMKQLKEQFIVASQGLGATLLPTLTELMQKLSTLIGKFNALPEPTKKLITKFTLFAGAGLLAAGAIGKIHTGIMEFMPVLSGLFTFIKGTAIPGLVSFQTAIGPIGWAIEAIIAVVALLVVAWKKDWGHIREHFDNFAKFFEKTVGKIKDGFNRIKDKITGVVEHLRKKIPLLNAYISLWETAFSNLKEAGVKLGEKIKSVFNGIVNKVKNSSKEIAEEGKSWAEWQHDRWSQYQAAAVSALGVVADTAATTATKVSQTTQTAVKSIIDGTKEANNAIINLKDNLIAHLRDVNSKALSDRIMTLTREESITEQVIQNEMDARYRQYLHDVNLIEKAKNAKLSAISAEIDNLMRQHEKQQRQNWLQEEKNRLASAKTAEERARIQKEIDSRLSEWQYQDKLDSLRKQADLVREEAQREIDAAKAKYEEDKKALETKLHNTKTFYEMQKSYIEKYYADLNLQRNLDAQAQKMLATKTMDEILTMLENTKTRWAKLGSDIGDAFWSNLINAVNNVKKMGGKIIPSAGNEAGGGINIGGGGSSIAHMFASGGFVSRPTLAVLGEKEPEFVIPQSKAGVFASQARDKREQRLFEQMLTELRRFNNETAPALARDIALAVNGIGGNV